MHYFTVTADAHLFFCLDLYHNINSNTLHSGDVSCREENTNPEPVKCKTTVTFNLPVYSLPAKHSPPREKAIGGGVHHPEQRIIRGGRCVHLAHVPVAKKGIRIIEHIYAHELHCTHRYNSREQDKNVNKLWLLIEYSRVYEYALGALKIAYARGSATNVIPIMETCAESNILRNRRMPTGALDKHITRIRQATNRQFL